jgi:CBS domain-containing protein
MKVRDVMTPHPFTIDPDAPVGTAIAVMAEKRLRHLPVVTRDGRLAGIVSDRDLRSAAFAPALAEHLSETAKRRLTAVGTRLEDLPVKRLMTAEVVTVGPEAPVAKAAALMLERHLGSLPVVADGQLVGIVTERDALRALAGTMPVNPALLW